ncbi:sensor domain-containing diguanylate cyclase [Paenibacillus agricola]|uniref:sensor domain-containing diguanylate cyclase n=1 Tax=Paenibacillus agricola TaxID=2716264 RepID=UPI0028930339|nr:diguanylate cyclase [Paenibacillus agricola]
MIDASGHILFHPSPGRIGTPASPNPVVQQLMAGQSGQQKVTNTEGRQFLAGYSYVPEVGWGVVSQSPVSNVEDNVRALLRTMGLYSLPLLVIVLLFVLWVSAKLSEPLNKLAHLASRLNKNEALYSQIPNINHWNYEANELYTTITEAFNAMRKRAEELSFEAQTDPLTGLTNRRSMESILRLWFENPMNFSIVMLDLDHFKAVNDKHGHQMGDEVLKFTARVMQSEKREHDFCCRYGGEEFTILLPDTTSEEAFLLAERIRTQIEILENPIGEKITISLGIASYPDSAQDLHTLFKYADQSLYEAKENGRNQTVLYSALKKIPLNQSSQK